MAGINQTLITIPEMNSFEDVRQALAKSLNQLQGNIASQLPVTNMQGKRLSNVGLPVAADDAVTLKYLQAGVINVQPTSVVLGSSTSTGAFSGVFIREIPAGELNGTNTVFTLTNAPNLGQWWLFLNGVEQDPYYGDAFVSGTNITYQQPPVTGDHHWIYYFYNGHNYRPKAFAFDVYPTGVNDDYSLRAGSNAEIHWMMTTSHDTNHIGPYPFVVTSTWNGWVPNQANSQWISPEPITSTFGTGVAGTYTYQHVFDITGFNPATAQIVGLFTADDQGTIILNTTTVLAGTATAMFGTLTAFTASSGFVTGLNTLTVVVGEDTSQVTGMQLQINQTIGTKT